VGRSAAIDAITVRIRLSSINPALTAAAGRLSSTQPCGPGLLSRSAGEEGTPRIVVWGEMCEGTETARGVMIRRV
jgi:hypothetical protein